MQYNIPTEIIVVPPAPQPAPQPRKTYIAPRLEDQGIWQLLTSASCGTIIFPGDPPPVGCS